ncbi:hypothetical protein ACN28C_27865 [Plantactinospora sp. WMMC1484]|uniref:hypothetical protein n=1 Tax=Plantactinospora sp. WMMC1484 TaxID=3404122 RepID=UPI003BF4DD4A
MKSRRRITVGLALALTTLMGGLGAAPASAYQSPLIWVGSPVSARWGESPSSHICLAKASPANDWCTDLYTPDGSSGQPAYLYVAPSNSAYDSAVTTKVSQIIDDSACRLGGGGDLVTVQIFYNGASYGQVTYAHLDRNPSLYVGQWVGRWGTYLGNMANLANGNGGGPGPGGASCWTGPHIHTELRATTQYACWNRGYVPYQSNLVTPNFIGFVSGPLNYGGKSPCP